MAMNPTNPVNPAEVPPARENVIGSRVDGYMENAAMQEAGRRGLVHWGAVWAGLLAALLTFLILETLAVGLGLFTPTSTTTANVWVTAIIALIAFFVGGLVSGLTSAARNPLIGVINGLAVWGLGTALILLLSLVGLSSLFGALGSIVGQFAGAGRALPIPPVTGGGVAEAARTGAWASFISLILSGVLAAVGGWLATRGVTEMSTAPRARPTVRRNAPA